MCRNVGIWGSPEFNMSLSHLREWNGHKFKCQQNTDMFYRFHTVIRPYDNDDDNQLCTLAEPKPNPFCLAWPGKAPLVWRGWWYVVSVLCSIAKVKPRKTIKGQQNLGH
jgi:hypothetical protein